MVTYDLSLAWDWEYDAEFVTLLEHSCRSHGLSLLEITPHNLTEVLDALANDIITFATFWDRASETDQRFVPILQWVQNQPVHFINPYHHASQTWDKTLIHWRLCQAGMPIPPAIIIPSYEEQPVLPPLDLSVLGDQFTIKPACGGGGDGVLVGATSLIDVDEIRRQNPTQRYLLQGQIAPRNVGYRPAWFRVIYCGEEIHPCWWDRHTGLYTPLTASDEETYGLGPLRELTASLADVSHLDLFSTEIAQTGEGLFFIVDYINDPIDLRLQSTTPDGVPDSIVRAIVERVVKIAATHSVTDGNPLLDPEFSPPVTI